MRAQTRRTDVLPLTWEIPTAIALAWLVGAVLSMLVGQGLSYLVSGERFAWPAQAQLGQSLLGLVSGRPGAGLRPRAAETPPVLLVYSCVAALELAVVLVALWVACVWWRTTGPGAQVGLATRPEVRAVLGSGPLRRRRRTIRPDLHHRPRNAGRTAP